MPPFLPQIGSRWCSPIHSLVITYATLTHVDDQLATLKADDGETFTLPLSELIRFWTRRRTLPARMPEAAE